MTYRLARSFSSLLQLYIIHTATVKCSHCLDKKGLEDTFTTDGILYI